MLIWRIETETENESRKAVSRPNAETPKISRKDKNLSRRRHATCKTCKRMLGMFRKMQKQRSKRQKQRLNGDCNAEDTKRYIRKEIVNQTSVLPKIPRDRGKTLETLSKSIETYA